MTTGRRRARRSAVSALPGVGPSDRSGDRSDDTEAAPAATPLRRSHTRRGSSAAVQVGVQRSRSSGVACRRVRSSCSPGASPCWPTRRARPRCRRLTPSRRPAAGCAPTGPERGEEAECGDRRDDEGSGGNSRPRSSDSRARADQAQHDHGRASATSASAPSGSGPRCQSGAPPRRRCRQRTDVTGDVDELGVATACSPNTGISAGPVRTASAIWVGVAACSGGALPQRNAPPAPPTDGRRRTAPGRVAAGGDVAGGGRRRHRRSARRHGGDVGDQRVDRRLVVGRVLARPRRLRRRQRHPPRGQLVVDRRGPPPCSEEPRSEPSPCGPWHVAESRR